MKYSIIIEFETSEDLDLTERDILRALRPGFLKMLEVLDGKETHLEAATGSLSEAFGL